MSAAHSVRLDKWLWAARVYKTRSQAAAACREGRVTIAGQPAKPSRDARIDDVILVRKENFAQTLKVLALLEQRLGAQAVKPFIEDLTPPGEYEKARQHPALGPVFHRPKGSGRPTKRDQRALSRISRLHGG